MGYNKEKIAWVVPKTYNTQSRIFKESQSLASRGYRIKIYSMNENNTNLAYENQNGVDIERVYPRLFTFDSDELLNRTLLLPVFTVKVIIRLVRFKPDLVYCSNLPSVHVGLICKLLFNAKVIYDSHDLFVEQPGRYKYSLIKRKVLMLYEGVSARIVDAVIQTTEGRCQLFKKYYGIQPIQIMNKPLPKPKEDGITDISTYLDEDKTIVGYVGSVLPNRGLEIMAEVATKFPKVQFVILGYAKGKWAQSFIDTNRERITLIPPVPPSEITSVLERFDIGISLIQNTGLSYFYSCPTKVFELIASGTPQIASNFPEIRKLVKESNGYPVGEVIDPSDPQQLTQSLERLLSSTTLYEKYKNNCVKIRHKCLWESEEKKLLKLVELVLK